MDKKTELKTLESAEPQKQRKTNIQLSKIQEQSSEEDLGEITLETESSQMPFLTKQEATLAVVEECIKYLDDFKGNQ